MVDEAPRSRAAREAAERALVRIVHHYGSRPEFVVLGGLLPELLCAGSDFRHAGTTDVDVQVDLEIACGATNTAKLERALRNAEFEPDNERRWRWIADGTPTRTVVKFELLADLSHVPTESTIEFDECEALRAVNLGGTRFASRDVVVQQLSARIGGIIHNVEVNVTGLAGFLLAKAAAAHARRKPKDWYDLAFVLLHNDAGGRRRRLLRSRIALASNWTQRVQRSTISWPTSLRPTHRDRAPMPSKWSLIIPTWIQECSLRTGFLRSRNSIDCCSRSDQCCMA